MTGERLSRMERDKHMAELAAYWAKAKEAAGAQTEDERQVCRRMLAKYQGEIERRETNGRGGKGD